MRLFIATTFPEAVLRPLNERVGPLRPRLPPASWVRPETQHLTLAFLGEQDSSMVDKLTDMVGGRVGEVAKFQARLQGCGFFPNPRHARVGWVGVTPPDAFSDLAAAVRDGVREAGVALDRDEFRAHLTVMRMREGWPPASIELFQRTLRDYCSEGFTVDHVTLYSSQLSPKGAVHTPLKQFALC
jgi:2'-5' RNA ligase